MCIEHCAVHTATTMWAQDPPRLKKMCVLHCWPIHGLQFYSLQTSSLSRCLVIALEWTLVCYGITGYEPTKKGHSSGGSSEKCGRTRSSIQTCGAGFSTAPAFDGWITLGHWAAPAFDGWITLSPMAICPSKKTWLVISSTMLKRWWKRPVLPRPSWTDEMKFPAYVSSCVISNKLIENCRPCYRTTLRRRRLSRVLVKKHL